MPLQVIIATLVTNSLQIILEPWQLSLLTTAWDSLGLIIFVEIAAGCQCF